MARLCTLASGSSGNSTYISTTDGDILVDAGISCKRIMAAIDEAGVNASNLKAVAITHTHDDHINGLKTFLKTTKLPLIASAKTIETLGQKDIIPITTKIIVAESEVITLGDMAIKFFKTSHDAEGSGGYVVHLPDGRRAAVCTDLGIVTDDVRNHLLGCETIVLESNHDIEMLRQGPYPANLKLRILSDTGHLSNNACAAELPDLLRSGTTRIILGHISKECNSPILAESTAKTMLASIGAKADVDYVLTSAKPKTVGVSTF